MKEVKIMVVPGKIARVTLNGQRTVLDAAVAARNQHPDIDWVELAKDREVRVQNRKFSNNEEVPEGYYGSIHSTPLEDNDVVLILTKIKGNLAVGSPVLTCKVNGTEYALETPDTVENVLEDVVGLNPTTIETVYINSEESPLDQMVGNNDIIEVKTKEEEVTLIYKGRKTSGSPAEIISRIFR